jgi:hypothetical protein
MRKPTRLFIAASEIISGAFLMVGAVVVVVMRVQVPDWYLLAAESVAVSALIAGYRLARNRPEGFKWSLWIQAAQVLQFLLPKFLYRVLLGPYLVIVFSMDETLVAPGFKGELTIGWKGPSPGAIGLNVVAVLLFFLLGRAILAQRREGEPPINAEPTTQ